MSNEFELEVLKRDKAKKNIIKHFRNEGQIPGIYYSHDSKESIPFYIKKEILRKAYKSGARIFSINVGDKKRTVIFKTVQYHPVTDQVMHVDLYGVKMDQLVTVKVSLKLVGTAMGTLEGGILVPGLNEIEIDCLPMDIPEFIDVDVSELNIGDIIRIENLTLDDKLSVKTHSNQIVASVTHPMKEEEPEPVDEDIEGEEFIEGETEEDSKEGDDKDNQQSSEEKDSKDVKE